MKLSDLLKPWVQKNLPDIDVQDLTNDSRCVSKGSLFIAYPGQLVDGRAYIPDAFSRGAHAVIYEPEGLGTDYLKEDKRCIAIPHLSRILPDLACRFYQSPSDALKITGVTGTNGKTTIAYLLSQAHQRLHQTSSYIGTLGHGEVFHLEPLQNTTPEPILLQKLLKKDLDKGVLQVCMEVSSHGLSLGRVAGVKFHQAIYTHLSHDHLDFHPSLEAYAEAKSMLFGMEGLQDVILNQDCPYVDTMKQAVKKDCKIWTYAVKSEADFKVIDYQMSLVGTSIKLKTPWGEMQFKTQLIGLFNVYNTLAVFASLLLQGYSKEAVIAVMQEIKAAPGRLEIIHHAPCVIVDYAHTPDALSNVLKTLKELSHNEIYLVFGCGGDRDKAKRPLMGEIAGCEAQHVIITSDNPRTEDPLHIMHEIAQGLPKDTPALQIEDRLQAIKYALSHAKERDIVLIAGKGHEDYQQIGLVRTPFSDQKVILKFYAPSV